MDRIQKADKGIFHLEAVVFPLLDVREGVEGTPATVQYLGTCFLTKMGHQHVFVTAKHLLCDTPDNYNLYLAYNTPEGTPSYLKVRAVWVNHTSRDMSFFLPIAEMKADYAHVFVPMNWLRCNLPIGQGALVYGFPNSGQQNGSDEVPVVNIRRTRHEGKVLGVEHDHPFAHMKTVYYLDFPAPEGLSGSPVMVIHDNALAVVGYILGEQTTDGKPVAVCTDNTPFAEMESLLIDVSRKLASEPD